MLDSFFSQMCPLQIFSLCGLSSQSLDGSFHRAEVFKFNEVYGVSLWACS